MFRLTHILAAGVFLACATASALGVVLHAELPQETGFLNRTLEQRGLTYRYQVYLPASFRRDDHKSWPVILFLHGRGERGTEGLWQTQIGLPEEVRDHPERWPFVIVMPQCPLTGFWTDPQALQIAMSALDREVEEFHLDTDRTYLAGLSMGGYGAWELAHNHPRRWAAVAIAAGGVFWSYAPERWQESAILPGKYARALGKTPIWLFHGSDDNTVSPRQSELMFDAFKANGGHVRLWIYQGLRHDCWTRAFNEPELPRWLLAHRNDPRRGPGADLSPFAERLVIPRHPSAIKLPSALLDALCGEYRDGSGHTSAILFRQGEQFFEKSPQGDLFELAAESPSVFFYPNGSSLSRLTFDRDAEGRINAVFHDDRHEERWEHRSATSRH